MKWIRYRLDLGAHQKAPCLIEIIAAIFIGVLTWSAAAQAAVPDPLDLAQAIQKRLANGIPALFCQVELPRFYALQLNMPVWVTDKGLRRHLPDLLTAIEASAWEGLRPADYHQAAIQERLSAFSPEKEGFPTLEDAVDLELLATDAYLLLGSHFRSGRVNPESIDSEWFANRRQGDLPRRLEQAVAGDAVRSSLMRLLPDYEGYRRLKSTFRYYRQLALRGTWPHIPDGKTLQREEHDERVPLLRTRLAMIFGTQSAEEHQTDLFDADLETTLKRFQEMHGLEADGRLGHKTLSALNVPINDRVDQIAANLERWRWLPEDLGDRYLLVNIANYRLDVIEKNTAVMTMGVIVGKPYRHTPVFSSAIRYLVFNPSWTVPYRIAVRDKLPLIRKDPSFLSKQGMRLYSIRGSERHAIDPRTVDWQKIGPANFPYVLYQTPGPQNALGRVKFMFPNRFNVYLHDTPNRELFARTNRNFSSGCVRLEHPLHLAAYVLRDEGGWNQERIDSVLASGKETTVPLNRPLPVHLLYWTVFTDSAGRVCFREDIYGRDRRLVAALNERPS
jgi:murein L,D-transpeptidase YcbB/YkuD